MRRYLLLCLILLGASAGSAQQPPAQPSQQPADARGTVTFRAETNFVEVHLDSPSAKMR